MTETLYRQPSVTRLEGTEIKYFPLSIAQSGIIYQILILATQESVTTLSQRAELTKLELLDLCVHNFVADQFISQMLLEPKLNELLYKLIGEVFPEIKHPYLLTDHNMMMLFAFLITEFTKTIQLKGARE